MDFHQKKGLIDMRLANLNYAILSSHRSGSSLLCNLLTQTGVVGIPNEYFSHWQGRSYNSYDVTNYPEYIHRVIDEMQTDNSVFGMKMMAGDDEFQGILKRLGTLPAYQELSNAEKIRTFFPNIKFIYLTRRNKVAQAISWWKAAQNNHYHTTDDTKMPDTLLRYDFDAISHLIKEVTMEECAHQEILSLLDVTPFTLVYEDYIQDMEGTVQKIIEFLGIEEPYTFQKSQLHKMADSLTQEWTERYRQELQDGWTNRRW